MRIILFILFTIVNITSCTNLPPVKTENSNKYVLNAAPQPAMTKATRTISLYVAPVESNPIYSTHAMAYSLRPYQVDYFAKNYWAAPPAKMLRPLMMQVLQKTHYFSSVSDASLDECNFALITHLIKLQQDFLPQQSTLHIVLQATLINLNNHQPVATQQFSITEIAPTQTPYGGVIAANKATGRLLTAISSFCVQNL